MNYLQDFQQAGTGHYELLPMGKADPFQQTDTLSSRVTAQYPGFRIQTVYPAAWWHFQ